MVHNGDISMKPHNEPKNNGFKQEDIFNLLRIFEGHWEALGIVIFLKAHGNGTYHLNELTKLSGIGKFRFKKLLKILADAKVVQYSLLHRKGLKLALNLDLEPILALNSILEPKLALNLEPILALNIQGKGTNEGQVVDDSDELRSDLTPFLQKLQCGLQPPLGQWAPPPDAGASSPRDAKLIIKHDLKSSLEEQNTESRTPVDTPTPMHQANSKQLGASDKDGLRQQLVRPKSEDTPIKSDQVKALWNNLAKAHNLRPVEHLHLNRLMMIDQIKRDFPKTDQWEKCFEKLSTSKWLLDKKWLSLDWVLKPTNFTDLVEGKYDNQNGFMKQSDKKSVHFTNYTPESWASQTEDPF